VRKEGAVLRALAPLLGATLLLVACSRDRFTPAQAPVFDPDVAPILQTHCVSCHDGASPAAGWSATSFLGTIACVAPSGAPATLPSGGRSTQAPILAALAVAPHVGLLTSAEEATLAAWVAAGAPASVGTVHPPGIVDPRSADFHGTLLRALRWSQMLDANDPNACGTCHEGTPARPAGVTLAAPGASACTTCHGEAQGVLACNTCHGAGARIYPPRDLCFFPGDAATAGAHAAHVEASVARPAGLACSTCHPSPPAEVIGGLHGDGTVDVIFDPAVVTPEASYDPSTKICAVACHDVGGARPRPAWTETTPMGCNDCHRSPPANHFPGSCTSCHAEANATGTALSGGPLHLNGRVDLGNGSGLCGACHGTGADPWPTTAAHPAHENPSLAAPLACTSCHVVPQTILDPTHLDGVVHVTFSGLALARGASPAWDGSACTNVACHGANLADPAAIPAWNDTSGAASKCGACHGIPPTEHTTSTSCGWSNCHGSEVGENSDGVPFITASGKSVHVNGVIDRAQ
jgi:predicted CxxxxCH...CXXCH cytochrome family protein